MGNLKFYNIFGDIQYNAEVIEKFSPRLRQMYVSLGPILITISLGMAEGYSSILIPQLKESSIMDIDLNLESWIASITALPMAIACFIGGFAMEMIGRRNIHVVDCIICLVGWIIIYFSTTPALLLVGRFVTGFSVGLIGPSTCVYLAETSDPNFRGFLLAAVSFAIAFGIVLSHFCGTLLSWQVVALIGCIFPIITIVLMVCVPESPTYLAKKGRTEAAKNAFYWCRGHGDDSEKELAILLERQDVISNKPKENNFKQYAKPEFWKPFVIMIIFFLTMQWCGSNAITFYNVSILEQSLGGKIDEYFSMLLMDLVRLIASIVACYLLKVVKRRHLALVSCVGVTASLLTLSIFMYCTSLYPNLSKYNYVLLVAFMAYMIFLTVGLIPVPWTMVGEVFPLQSRGVGSAVTAMINYGFIFSVVKTVPFMFDNLGVDGTFLFYGLISLGGTIFLAVFLPETKDKPLHEIEDYFKGTRRNVEIVVRMPDKMLKT